MPSSRKLVSRFPLQSSRLNRRCSSNRQGTANIFILFVMHCRALTRATYILCIEHLRLMHLSQESKNRTQDLLHCRQTLSAKRHWNGVINCYSEPGLVLLKLPPQSRDVASSFRLGIVAEFDSDADILDIGGVEVWIEREGSRRSKLYCMRGSRALNLRSLCENCIMSGSPLWRGLIQATYILCIEHLRQMYLSPESNPGPPALQANTLCKEPFEKWH
jgi:hypothetical protein